jgi:hypothetical protein
LAGHLMGIAMQAAPRAAAACAGEAAGRVAAEANGAACMRPQSTVLDRLPVVRGGTDMDREIAAGLQARFDTRALIARPPHRFMHCAASLPQQEGFGR